MKKLKAIVNLINSNGKISAFFLAALGGLSFQTAAAAQTVPQPEKKPTPKIYQPTPNPEKPVVVKPGQRIERPPVTPRPNPLPPRSAAKVIVNESSTPAEKSIATESKVSINLCVREGNIKINGWDRDEIRAYIEQGSEVGFKIMQDNPKTKKPVWVNVVGYDPKKNKEMKPEECLSGREIELDVPRNATIKLKSAESEIRIESVAKVWAANLGGDIFLNDISSGIDATTYRGDLTVEHSSGQIVLTNTDGNIIALDVEPSEIGDIFKAKTGSGRITLQAIGHRQIETSSISGSTSFAGELLSGAQYGFSTENGSIVMSVPPDSSCKINASFGFGAFGSEIPLVNTLKKEQSLSAQLGDAEASCGLTLRTGSGIIRIRNRKPASININRKEPEKPVKPVSVQTTDKIVTSVTAGLKTKLTTALSFTTTPAAAKKAKKRNR